MNEFSQLKKAILSRYPLDEASWSHVEKELVVKNLKKGDFLVREGEMEDKIYFISSGISRNFFVKGDKEFTIDFHFEGDFVTGYYSIITNKPSIISVEALTDLVIVVIPFNPVKSTYATSVEAANFGRLIAEFQYIKRLTKEMDLMAMTAEERYHELLQVRPDLVKKISVKHISSYLGIQPESLSRIRKNYNM